MQFFVGQLRLLALAHFYCRDALELFRPALTHRESDGVVGKLAPQFLFHLLNHLFRLLRTLGEAFQHIVADALNFKAMIRWPDLITDLLNSLRQFIAIGGRGVTNGVIHSASLQRLPALLLFVERGVENREVGVQLRIE